VKTFIDNAGRTWALQINVSAVKRVRGLVGIDLYKLIDDGLEPLAKLVSDPVDLADVLYCLVRDEADAKQISDEEFGRALAGDAITAAADAFVEELIDFFPEARARAALRKTVQAGKQVRSKVLEHLEGLVQTLDVDSAASRLISSFGSLPESSASIQERSHSENLATWPTQPSTKDGTILPH
jgi:hypothetical protein